MKKQSIDKRKGVSLDPLPSVSEVFPGSDRTESESGNKLCGQRQEFLQVSPHFNIKLVRFLFKGY